MELVWKMIEKIFYLLFEYLVLDLDEDVKDE
jgi:hypothetical protein